MSFLSGPFQVSVTPQKGVWSRTNIFSWQNLTTEKKSADLKKKQQYVLNTKKTILLPFNIKQPANLFMSKDFKLTLIDYGNARQIQSPDGQLVDAVGVTEFTGNI